MMETTETSSPESKPLEEGGEVSGLPQGAPVRAPWWVRIVPFFLSAFFFLSVLFAVFSPLPLLFLRFRSGRLWVWLAVLTNGAIVGFAGGRLSLAMYATFVAALALSMGELIHLRKSLEKTAMVSMVTIALTGAVLVSWHSHIHHVNPVEEFRREVSTTVDFLQQSMTSQQGGSSVNPEDMDEWKRNVMLEFPSGIALFALLMTWANLTAVLRVNPGGIREKMGLDASFVRNWKLPEWLIWPTIVAGFFLLVDVKVVSVVALNLFRFLMAIYAIQGLSILSFFFDVWNIRGFFRTVGFLIAIFLMLPLLLSLGFFDLWFDSEQVQAIVTTVEEPGRESGTSS